MHTTSTDPKALAAVQLVNANLAFIGMVQSMRPPPAWLDKKSPLTFDLLRATPEILRRPEFALVRTAAGAHGPFYVANVYAKDDRRQQPIYLYLIVINGNRAGVVRAFHFEHGKASKIAG